METPFLSWRRRTADPLQIDDFQLTLEALALVIRWPGGGWVWNLPLAVQVSRSGNAQRMFIVDWNRFLLWALGALAAGAGLMALSARIQKGK